MILDLAVLAERGAMPLAGGLLDQPAWWPRAAAWVLAEIERWRSEAESRRHAF